MSGAQQPVELVEATPDDVAALLRARTKDQLGNEVGRFLPASDTAGDPQTRPTAEQVQEQIDIARSLTRLDVGLIPDGCMEGGETVVALLAALLVEQGYWPEQVQSERSAYDRLLALYQQARLGLVACVQGNQPGAGGPEQWRVYDVDISGGQCALPFDWWQRNLDQVP